MIWKNIDFLLKHERPRAKAFRRKAFDFLFLRLSVPTYGFLEKKKVFLVLSSIFLISLCSHIKRDEELHSLYFSSFLNSLFTLSTDKRIRAKRFWWFSFIRVSQTTTSSMFYVVPFIVVSLKSQSLFRFIVDSSLFLSFMPGIIAQSSNFIVSFTTHLTSFIVHA